MGQKRDTFIAAFEADLGQILNAKKKYSFAKKGPFDGQEQRFNGRDDQRGAAFFREKSFWIFSFLSKKGRTSLVASTIKSLVLADKWPFLGKIILFFGPVNITISRIKSSDKSMPYLPHNRSYFASKTAFLYPFLLSDLK